MKATRALNSPLNIQLADIPTPPFTNTYSLDYDGVDDYLNLGNGISFEYTDSFSYSFWVNPNAVSGSKNLYTKYDAGRGIYTYLNSASGAGANALYFFLLNTNSGSTATRKRITTNTGAIISPNVWTNIVITYDGSGLGTGINVYKNGVSQTVTVTQDNLQNSTIVNTVDSYLCAFSGISSFFTGGQDEFSIFNTELSAADALAIYNSGQPTDLTDLSPVAWYRMGDNGSYKSPQWLLPSNENKDKVSNYSCQFDGVDETIFCGIDASRQVQTLTMSVWVKPTAFARDGIVLNGHVSYGNQGIEIYWNFNQFGVRINGSTYGLGSGNGQNNWSHILVAYDGNTLKRMTNGVPLADVVIGATINYTNYNGLTIGRSPYGFHIGNIDEFAFWNSDQSANFSTIYGTGVPNDLTDLSPIAWYRMGEEATFSGGVWTVPDQVGSNDGTSNAMTIEDRVGEAPNSENNALSYNMDLVDRVTDVP